jgi:hypothetical protein
MWWATWKYENELLVNIKTGEAIDASPDAKEGLQVYTARVNEKD